MQHHQRRHPKDGTAAVADQATPTVIALSDSSDADTMDSPAAGFAQNSAEGVRAELRAKLASLEKEREQMVAEIGAIRKVIEVFDREELHC